ncbi:MAG: VCBS repeat-containing protein, partial [Planctomycetes bacterium]|nr:VCBS repeat-containing protein [Planctomycetota bacterium]
MEAIRHRNGNPTTTPCACALLHAKWAVLLSLAALLGQQSLAEQRGPAWSVHVIDSGLSGGDGVRLLDVDDDGDLDLAVGWEQSGVVRLYLNPGPVAAVRSKWPAIDCGPAPNVEDAMPADIDGDGRIDVVSCTEGSNRRVLVHFAPREGSYADSAA